MENPDLTDLMRTEKDRRLCLSSSCVRSYVVAADKQKQSGGSLLKRETELGPFSADK